MDNDTHHRQQLKWSLCFHTSYTSTQRTSTHFQITDFIFRVYQH